MNINLTLLAQAASFAIFIWFTARFVWPPLMRAIDNRSRAIAEGLAAAERGQQSLREADQRVIALEREAHEKAKQIIADTEARAAQYLEEQRAAAKAEGARLLAMAKAEVEQEAERARQQLREQLASLVVLGAEEILRREIDPNAHAALLKQMQAQL